MEKKNRASQDAVDREKQAAGAPPRVFRLSCIIISVGLGTAPKTRRQ